MGIKKKSSGTYTVSFSKRHPITRESISRRRIGLKSKAEANRVYAELVVIVSDKLKREVIPTWPIFLDQYLSVLESANELTKGTIYKREKVLKKHTLPFWENKCMDEITGQDIKDILQNQFINNAESHKKFFIKGIRSVMQSALDRGLISRDPTPKIKFKENDKIKLVLNEQQILILLRKAQELDWEWYPVYAVALFTGLRSGELYSLTWDKVNFEKRQILVDTSWTSKDGYKSTKSGHDRITMIPEPLMPVLQELKLKSAGEKFVLPRLWQWDQGSQARILKLFLKSIGLPEVRFHDLRASWATLLLSKGTPPSQAMSMGGWSDMKTMMIYMRKAGINIQDAT